MSIVTVNHRAPLKVSEVFSQPWVRRHGTSGCEGKHLNLDSFQVRVCWDYVQTDTFCFSFAPFVRLDKASLFDGSRGVWISRPEGSRELRGRFSGRIVARRAHSSNCSHLVFPWLGVLRFGVGVRMWHFVIFIRPSLLISGPCIHEVNCGFFEVIRGVRQTEALIFGVSESKSHSLHWPKFSVPMANTECFIICPI